MTDRTSRIPPTSELGSGYIPFSVGSLNVGGSVTPTASGTYDLGSDAQKTQRVWSDNAYFGGNEGKLIFDGTKTVVNGATGSNHAMVIRTSGYQDGIHIEYSPDTNAHRRGIAGAIRIHNRHYTEVIEGEEELDTINAYGRTALWVDNNGNNCWGMYMLNNLTDPTNHDNGADDRKGVYIYGDAGGAEARGLLVEHNNNTVGSVGAEFKNIDGTNPAGSLCRIHLDPSARKANGLNVIGEASSSTEPLAFVQSNAGTSALRIDQKGNSYALQVGCSGTSTAALIAQHGNAYALNVQQNGTAVGLNVEKLDTSTGHGIRVDNDGTGYGIYVEQDGAANAIRVNQNANADGAYIRKLGTGAGSSLVVDDEGAGTALYVISEGSGGNGLFITHTPNTVIKNIVAANESYSSHMSYLSCHRSANSAYSFLTGISDSNGTPDTEVKLRGDGVIQSDQAATTPADYAEYFETVDPAGFGAGLAVQMCEDQANASKVELATDATKVVGFVSAAPAIIGDSAWSRWTGKYLKDKFGAYQLDEDGDRVLNPEFDSEQDYQPRADRPEWQTIGMLGKLWIRSQDTDILPGQRVTLGDDGLVRRALDDDTVSWHVSEVRKYDAADDYQVVRIIYK
jgi:hypothetical protein